MHLKESIRLFFIQIRQYARFLIQFFCQYGGKTMGNFLINAIGILILIFLAFYVYNRVTGGFDKRLAGRIKTAREKLRKSDVDRIGKRIVVPREGKKGVTVNLYRPSREAEGMPAVFVAHGGSFMDGDADQLDSYCARMADQWDSLIVNINYTTMDVEQFPWQQEEIQDTVLYFAVHASEFGIDAEKFSFVGFSAGAYLQIGAAAYLKEKGFRLCGMIAFYPFIDDAMIHLADMGMYPEPFTLVTTGSDAMKDREPVLIEHLKNAGTDLNIKEYADAVQGFAEYNNPEYADDPLYQRSKAVSEDQAVFARACEIWTGSELERFIQEKTEKR